MEAVELPFLTKVFAVSELNLDQWGVVLGMGVLMILIVETVKFFERKADARSKQ